MKCFKKNFLVPFYSQPQTMEVGRGEAKRMFGTFLEMCVKNGHELTPPDI